MPIEAKIIRKVVRALKANGTPVIAVGDGYDEEKATTEQEIFEQVFNLDISWLMCNDGNWVMIVLGNEWDVISDYTLGIEDAMKPIDEYIDKNC